jgi:spore coat protein H
LSRLHVFSFFCLLLLPALFVNSQDPSIQADETVRFFESGVVPELKLLVNETSQQEFRDTPREYARCTLEESSGMTFRSIGVKLKGAAGSYSDFDDRPGLTLTMDKYKDDQTFHGMEKFHLNNALQDESLLSEWIGSEMFRHVGLIAPRVGHVRLRINDRDMGLYVLREGFDQPFLKRSFEESTGNLYDGGFIQDVDSELELDKGREPDDRTDLVELASACFHPNPETRWKLISDRLDMDRFISFMAMERICGHWDGYTLNKNNYRIYFPVDGKAIFLPHGMDQLFTDPGAGLFDHSPVLLAAAVMQSDVRRDTYQSRLRETIDSLQPVEMWLEKIDVLHSRLRPILESISEEAATNHTERVREFKERLAQRFAAFPDLIRDMPVLIEFVEAESGSERSYALRDWNPVAEGEQMSLEEVDVDGVSSYVITRDPFGDFVGSWRHSVLLPRGNYRFEARVKTQDVIPIPEDPFPGAGIRRTQSGRSHEMVGTNEWTLLKYDIAVPEDQRQVELILELRARHGTAWFDRQSLRLVKLKD